MSSYEGMYSLMVCPTLIDGAVLARVVFMPPVQLSRVRKSAFGSSAGSFGRHLPGQPMPQPLDPIVHACLPTSLSGIAARTGAHREANQHKVFDFRTTRDRNSQAP